MKSQIKILKFLFASFVFFAGHSLFAQGLVSDLTVQRTVRLGASSAGTLTPTTLAADADDYAPTGHASAGVLRLSSDASRSITGLAGGAIGRVLILYNIGAEDIILTSEDSASTAANRFALAGDLTLPANGLATLIYDYTSSRWRTAAGSGSGGGGGAGTVTNTGGNLTSNYLVLGAGTVDTKVAAGLTTDGTSKIILGVAGTSVGSLDFKNATSGTINLHAPTGALSTGDITLPLGTVTLATLAGTEALTNKSVNGVTLTTGGSTSSFLNANGAYSTPAGGGSGDFVGPGSSTDNALMRFDSTTGKLGKNSNVTLADSGVEFVFSAAAGLKAGGSNNDVTLVPTGTGYLKVGDSSTPTQLRFLTSTSGQGLVTFMDGADAKWQFGKQTDNTFILYDNAGSRTIIKVTTGTELELNPAGNVKVSPTTASSSTTTGSFINAGGFGNAGAFYNGGVLNTASSITTGAPSGGTAAPFKIGTVASVSPTSPNRTIQIEISGTTYYLTAKTTND